MRLPKLITTLLFCWLLMTTSLSQAAGLLTVKNSNLPALELKQHKVDLLIQDGYATTTVEQIFYNPNQQELEAIYSFPVPEKAAVGEFIYWIDDKPMVGEVLEKSKARTIYKEEKAAGREAALLEKDSYKTFDMTVYPVPALDQVKTRLVYIQPIDVDTSIGRYVYPLENGGTDEQAQSFWSYNETVSELFEFNMRFRSSYPIGAIRLPKHPNAEVKQVSAQEWRVRLVSGNNQMASNAVNDQEFSADDLNDSINEPLQASQLSSQISTPIKLDQDIVVYWRQASGLPGALDLMTYKKDLNDKGTFMLSLTPGDDLAPIFTGRDWVFVLDISGSMKTKYQTLIEGIRKGLDRLSDKDRFKVILFNNQARLVTTGFEAVNKQTVQATLNKLEQIRANGGTNLYAGLAMGLLELDSDRSTGVVLVSDGVANVGVVEKKRFLDLLKKYDIRLFTFILGNNANRPLLENMANVSKGFAMPISNSDDIIGQITLAASKLTHQSLRNIKVSINGVKTTDMTPEAISSIYRGEQLQLFGHYWQGGLAEVVFSANLGGETIEYKVDVEFPNVANEYPELERLWAFAAIENLQNRIDYLGTDKDTEQAIVDIALQYGLVTDYTSMLTVREESFRQRNIQLTNTQRVSTEQAARKQRQQQPVTSYKNNNNQSGAANYQISSNQQNSEATRTRPTVSRSGSSRGGAIDILFAVLCGLFLFISYMQRFVEYSAESVE